MPTDLRRETGTQLSEDSVSTLPPVCTEMHDRRCSRQRLPQHRRAATEAGRQGPRRASRGGALGSGAPAAPRRLCTGPHLWSPAPAETSLKQGPSLPPCVGEGTQGSAR